MKAITIWKEIPGFPGYEVSSDGQIYTHRRKRLLKPFKTHDGYYRCALQKDGKKVRGILVHRMVLLTFVGPRPAGCETRHLNGIASDNRVEENYRDRIRHGTDHRGERNVFAKLTKEQVLSIRGSVESCRKTGRRFGVSHTTVEKIRNREKWAWL